MDKIPEKNAATARPKEKPRDSRSATVLHGGHRLRLRTRAMREGLDGFEPHEVIEFLLCYAIPRQDVNELAHALLDRFGTVGAVLNAERQELLQVSGVGRGTADWLMLIGETVNAYGQLELEDRPLLQSFLQVFRHALALNRRITPPSCWQLCLDFNGRLVYEREISPSLSWGESATLREALSDALLTRARSVLLIEFVGPLPTEPDDYEMRHIPDYAFALHAAGCELLDVLLVGLDGVMSLRQKGLVPSFRVDDVARSIRENYLAGSETEEDRHESDTN